MNYIHDLINPETGKSYKQENLEKQHDISIGSLVELSSGVRLFVVEHIRDCDGTPLYRLSAEKDQQFQSQTIGNYSQENLRLI